MDQVELTSPKQSMSKLVRGAIYIAIGALVLAAVVCVVWVFIPDQGDLIGRAFVTVLLLSGFSGAVLLDANLANRRSDWLVLASTASWVIALLVGAFKIWAPRGEEETFAWEVVRLWELLLVIGLVQLALLHQRLYWRAHARYVTGLTRTIAIVTTVFLIALVGKLTFYLAVPHLIHFSDWYWRVTVALAILASVGTLLVPLLNALFAPRPVRPMAPSAPPSSVPGAPSGQPAASAGDRQPWPMFPDGRTPLPYLPNGQPDFAAAQTGVPSPGAQFWGAPQQPAPMQPSPVQQQPQPRQGGDAQAPGSIPPRPAPPAPSSGVAPPEHR
ncbi:hypothetical protein [Microbacterium halotolerans]|uniref:hypothetical protein n=1 Tax=Microbacterium halotolerans TaxID=246613 RepID=UPI000E6AB91C|nr:hypothetical protein [Microbacterium halotolerans]